MLRRQWVTAAARPPACWPPVRRFVLVTHVAARPQPTRRHRRSPLAVPILSTQTRTRSAAAVAVATAAVATAAVMEEVSTPVAAAFIPAASTEPITQLSVAALTIAALTIAALTIAALTIAPSMVAVGMGSAVAGTVTVAVGMGSAVAGTAAMAVVGTATVTGLTTPAGTATGPTTATPGTTPYWPSYDYPSSVYYGAPYVYPSSTVVPDASLSVGPVQAQELPDATLETAPPPQAVPAPGTFPYDGGPRNPPPMPKADPAPSSAPATLPLDGHAVSLPRKPAYTYPAFGESLKKAAPVKDRGNTYLIRAELDRPASR